VTAIGLAFAASVLWGVGDFLGGLTSRRLATLAVVALSQLFGFVGILVAAVFLGGDFPGPTAVAAAMAAGLAGAIGLAGLYRGMAIGVMGVVAPISASAAVIPVTVGLARGERPSSLQLAGVALALVGVVLVSREPGDGRRLSAGVPLALVAALGFGGYFVFMDRASAEDAYWAVVVARAFSSTLAIGVAAARGALRVGRGNLPVLLAVGLFDVAANLALALALNEGLVSLVSVVASLYPVGTVLLAVLVLRERLTRSQALGGAVALAGVGLISGGAA
jgi:drug/metabolite transporter (DMT)-like permease